VTTKRELEEPRLTPGEARLMKILRRQKKPIKTTDLVKPFYGDEAPEFAASTIVYMTRRLAIKTANAKVKVKRSERAGPFPIEVWLEE
jgi:hypothetical protein